MELIGEKVKELMRRNNMSTEELAQKLNIKDRELILKLNGSKEFLASEASDIANIFELTIQEFAHIFLNSKVSKDKKEKITGKYKQTEII